VKSFLSLAVGIVLVLPGNTAFAQDEQSSDTTATIASTAISRRERAMHIYKSKPRRIDEPLRDTNISDIEVREIESVTRELHPGAIVNISGVTAGCPCEDGPTCEDQVWVVAHRNALSKGLMLSRIENHWTVGPVQKWWLRYDDLQTRRRERWADGRTSSREEIMSLQAERQQLMDAFPACAP